MVRLPLRFASLLLLPFWFAGIAQGQRGGDVQAQILYAFHAEDVNQLSSMIQSLDTQALAGGADSALRYDLAHANFRYGLLGGTRARDAATAFAQCIDQLRPLLERNPDSVEALGLQSACYAHLARFKKLESVLLRSRAAQRLRAAFRLAPQNPRVVYLKAMEALAHAEPGSVESSNGRAGLQLAAQLFEQSSATGVGEPDWGHAEAYLELGRQLEVRGDLVGARNWIEKSLLMAPDYKAAQRQLKTLVHP